MLREEEPGKDRTNKSHASGKSHTVYLRYTTLYNISKFRHASGQERKKKKPHTNMTATKNWCRPTLSASGGWCGEVFGEAEPASPGGPSVSSLALGESPGGGCGDPGGALMGDRARGLCGPLSWPSGPLCMPGPRGGKGPCGPGPWGPGSLGL